MADKKLPQVEKLYTSREAASQLGVTPRTIQLWSESGILQSKKTPGGHRRFTAAAIEALTSEFNKGDNAGKASTDRIRVLIAEDEPDLRKLYEMTMSAWDVPMDMVIVKDGYEALIQFGKTNPHVLILDLNMPRMDGFHMLSVIRDAIGPDDTEVIVVTALSKNDIIEHGGMPDDVKVYSKPIPFADIEDLLRQTVTKGLSAR